MRISTAVLFLTLIGGISACGSSPPAPSITPPPPPPPSPPAPLPVQLAVFNDSSGFMTSDVRDVQGQIVRFDTANHALIWAATDRSFSGYPVSGNFIGSNRAFEVRFGTEAGERRAYFTETGPETICDIDVVNGQLVILPTNVRVPGGGS